MDIFHQIISFLSGVPDWVALLLFPGVAALFALLIFFIGKRSWFARGGVFFGLCGFVLMCCKSELRDAFVWAGFYAVWCMILRIALCIPRPKRAKDSKGKTKEDRIYEKFYVSLTDEEKPIKEAKPPKVSCFADAEEAETYDMDESGLRLAHVTSLLERLRSVKLSAGDRLETDVLMRTLDGFRNRRLTAEEADSLNDCLASVLKLTAKYQL